MWHRLKPTKNAIAVLEKRLSKRKTEVIAAKGATEGGVSSDSQFQSI
ncbi:MAG: hypothetical protein WBM44_06480 [Waterburya sp.]